MPTHKIVVVGAGFAGTTFINKLKGLDVSITLVDRRNHHLFQPLLYQVATALLSPADIAWPIRQLFRDRADVRTILGEVTGVDTVEKAVVLSDGDRLPYDTLVIATGATHAYFGHDEWAPIARGLKTVEDALAIRRRILQAFESAERETDPAEQEALMTFAIIGGGPTGVELAGMIPRSAVDQLPGSFEKSIPAWQGSTSLKPPLACSRILPRRSVFMPRKR